MPENEPRVRWLCCDLTVAGRSVTLCVEVDRELEAGDLHVAIPAPDVDAQVRVDIPRDRCQVVDEPPGGAVIVGRLLGPAG